MRTKILCNQEKKVINEQGLVLSDPFQEFLFFADSYHESVRARTDFVKVQTFLFTSVAMTAKRNFKDTLNYKGYSYFVWKSFIMTHGFFVL